MKAFLLLGLITMVMTMTGVAQPVTSRLRIVGFQLVLPWRLLYYESSPFDLPAGIVAMESTVPAGVSILSCNSLTPRQYNQSAMFMTQACGGVSGIRPGCTYHMRTVQDFNPNWSFRIRYFSGSNCNVTFDKIDFCYNAISPVCCCP